MGVGLLAVDIGGADCVHVWFFRRLRLLAPTGHARQLEFRTNIRLTAVKLGPRHGRTPFCHFCTFCRADDRLNERTASGLSVGT